MKINNLMDYAKARKFIVFNVVDGKNWFFDAWDTYDRALQQALEVGGQVAPVEVVEE